MYIAEKGRATNAVGVYAIRQGLIDAGKLQSDPINGLKVQNDPDGSEENLGWAGTGTAPLNQPPTANFSSFATNLTVSFTDLSTDDGTLVSWSWDFGDGSSSTVRNPSHAYISDGTYTVTLTVSDDGGLTDYNNQAITVSNDPPDPTIINLTATYQVVKNRLKVSLTWTPANITADIYRDGVKIGASTTGTYADNIKNTGS